MDQKRIQCLLNASQHVPIYLQPFRSNSSRKFNTKLIVRHFSTFFAHFGLPWVYAPGTIEVNVTRLERRLNACKTHRRLTQFQEHSSTILEFRENVLTLENWNHGV